MRHSNDLWLLAIAIAGTCAWGATPALAWSSMGAALCLLFAGRARDWPMRWWPAAFIGYAAALTFASEVPARSVYFVSQWIAWFAAFALAATIAGARFRLGWVAFASAQSVYGLVQYLADHDYMLWLPKTKYLDEATGTYINHNHYAGLLAMALPLTLQAASGKSGARPLLLLAALVELLAIVFSRSRAGILCAVLGILVYVLLLRNRRLAAAPILVLVIASAYGAWIGWGPVAERFRYFSRSGYLEREGRLAIWRDTWQLVRQKPWTGWGPGTFPSVYPLVRTESSDLIWMEAHNDYLQFLVELGIAGTLLFFGPLLWLIARLAVRAWQNSGDPGASIAAAMIAILAHCAVDFHLYVPANAVWILILAGMAARELSGVWVRVDADANTVDILEETGNLRTV